MVRQTAQTATRPEFTHAFSGKRMLFGCFNFDHIFNVASFFLCNYRIQQTETFRCMYLSI